MIAHRELALAGPVLGDVAEPQAVRLLRGEVPLDQVVVDRRAWLLAVAPALLPKADHQPRCEQIFHAVRSAITSPPSRASSTRNRYPNSGSSRWASDNAFARYAAVSSACVIGLASQR